MADTNINVAPEGYDEKINYQYELRVVEQALEDSDYKAIKFAEGIITPEEYAPIKEERARLRVEVNRLRPLYEYWIARQEEIYKEELAKKDAERRAQREAERAEREAKAQESRKAEANNSADIVDTEAKVIE